MTSFQRARYALWNHVSAQMTGSVIEWRETPKSKAFIAIVPPTVLPGTVEVVTAEAGRLVVHIDDDQAEALSLWTGGLPSAVMPLSAVGTLRIRHEGPFTCLGPDYVAGARLPCAGERVRIRVVASVAKVGGPMRKTQLTVVDVLHRGVLAADDA